jgi:peptide/nickel transport system substrate-binding protein
MPSTVRILVIASISIILASCEAVVSPEPTPSPGSTPPATPDPAIFWTDDPFARFEVGRLGGQVTVGTLEDVLSFHPFLAEGGGSETVTAAMWSSVLTLSDEYRFVPDLALSVPTLDNGGVAVPRGEADAMTVTWTLKPDLMWSDGERLTCDDFRYAWEWVMDPANDAVSRDGWELVTNIDCETPVRIVLHFKAVYEGYALLLRAPLPRHYLEAIPMADQLRGAGFAASDLKSLPVSGPFRVESWTPGVDVTLVPNPHYRSFATGLAPRLERIVLRTYPDAARLIEAFLRGDLDLGLDVGIEHVEEMVDLGLGIEILSLSALEYEVLRLNWGRGPSAETASGCSRSPTLQVRGAGCPTADVALRRAIELAIDRPTLNDEIFGGGLQLATSAVPPAAWYFSEQPLVPYDPEAAREVLTEAGWIDTTGDGVRELGGLEAQIELCTSESDTRRPMAERIAAMLSDIGMLVHVTVIPESDLLAAYADTADAAPCALSRGNFDMALLAGAGSVDPIAYLEFHSNRAPPNGGNIGRVADPEIDAALEMVSGTLDFQAIKAAMARFQGRYADVVAEVPLFYQQQVELHTERLGNYFASTAGPTTWNVADWFIRD